MKSTHSIFLQSLAICFSMFSSAYADETKYSTQTNIAYYEEADTLTDAYQKERCVLDVYYPEDVEGYSTLVWFHGGALKGGKKGIAYRLKKQGIAVVAVNYRLYPKVDTSKCLEDSAAAVAWVFKHIEELGGDPSRIFVSGHSAGGYLALMLGMDPSWLAAHEVDANRIAGLIPFSGHTITHMTVRQERGISSKQPIVDQYAPLFHVRADAPPLLLITGDRELELLGRYEENAYMMRMMKVVGHPDTRLYELDGYGHSMVEPAYPLLLKEIKRLSPVSE